jgi:hypothetical protein
MVFVHRLSKLTGPLLLLGVLFVVLAGEARALTPSMIAGMPPDIRSWRDEILPKDEYAKLADQWRDYTKKHPQSAVAYVQLARALRYSKGANADERDSLVDVAYKLDPNCPEVLAAMADRTHRLQEGPDFRKGAEQCREWGEKAVELAPDWAYPHFALWSLCYLLGRKDEADVHLRAILEKGGYSAPIVDFGYNLLVSAPSGSIVLTNGDNDTYPPLALQAARGIGRDVAIVNLSLLNRLDYATQVFQGISGGAPFSEAEIRSLHDGWKDDTGGDPFSVRVMKALLEKVRRGQWSRPVYFAVTVTPYYLDQSPVALEIEGLLWRVTRDPKPQASAEEGKEEEPRVDVQRTLDLYRNQFRLESATDLAFPWTPTAAASMLIKNYPAVLIPTASAAAEKGDIEDARFALRESIRILDFHGDKEKVKWVAGYWKKIDPDNPEIDRWL